MVLWIGPPVALPKTLWGLPALWSGPLLQSALGLAPSRHSTTMNVRPPASVSKESCFSFCSWSLTPSWQCLLAHFCHHKHQKTQASQERTCKPIAPRCTSSPSPKAARHVHTRHQLSAHVQSRNPRALSRKQTLSPGPLLPGLPH